MDISAKRKSEEGPAIPTGGYKLDQYKEVEKRKKLGAAKEFEDYYKCIKEKERWYKKPWKNVRPSFKVDSHSVTMSCNLW